MWHAVHCRTGTPTKGKVRMERRARTMRRFLRVLDACNVAFPPTHTQMLARKKLRNV